MTRKDNPALYHSMAIVTAAIWGTTFVSTKVLISHGLTPAQIFFCRFLLAYIGIWLVCPRKLFAGSLKDEMLMAAAGLTGGSLYFLAENTALGITLASNVSLIICTTPLLTAFLSSLVLKSGRPTLRFIVGALVALAGVALVVFNGRFVLELSPLGDILTLTAALMWASYSIVMKLLENKYSPSFITRKVFFYGLLTILPVVLFSADRPDFSLLQDTIVVSNLLFLGLVASLLCYLMWNTAIKQIGIVRATNYIYMTPVVSMVTAAIAINEKITPIAIAGSILILLGVYSAERAARKASRAGSLKS